MPNTNGEIHLDPIDYREIYDEYVSDIMHRYKDRYHLEYTQWRSLWQHAFSHVRIREYKAVTGKCQTCAILTEVRRQRKDVAGRTLINELHGFHRLEVMGERDTYYQRQQLALDHPDEYMSIIVDGMAQNHTELPYLANLNKTSNTFGQHIVGIIEHGQEFVVYRTFDHMKGASVNFILHCISCQLERRINRRGKLPPTLFIQIDGGPDMMCSEMLAFCNLIVANFEKTGVRKVVLTRLLVGHTHEDIDARFGNIWVATRDQSILSPDQYANILKGIFGNGNILFTVVDVLNIADYSKTLLPVVDPLLSG